MNSFLKLIVVLVLAFAVGFFGIGFAVNKQGAGEVPPERQIEMFAQQVVELVNAERAARKLPPVKLQYNLREAAMWLARDMAEKGYLSHTDSVGRDFTQRFELYGYYNPIELAENIAMGARTPQEAVNDWMKSEQHRTNMLNPNLREIGVGLAVDDRGRRYWVQDFGTRVGVYPLVINNEAAATTRPDVELYIHADQCNTPPSSRSQRCDRQIRLSNNGMTWTPWETYAPVRSWTLAAGSGPRQVQVELRSAGKTFKARDTIELRR
jgi:hypothetical protein